MRSILFFSIVWIAIVLLVVPVTAFPPPVDDPNIPVCGDVNFFFWNDSSDYGSSYQRLATYPQLQNDGLFSTSVASGTGPKTIADFITDEFKDGATMAPGLSRFRTFLNVSSAVGITTVEFIPYYVAPNGTQYQIWYGTARTDDVDEIETTPFEHLHNYARRNYTYFEPGSRFMIRVNSSTTSTVLRTVSLNVAGNNYASMVGMGYWLCDGDQKPRSPVVTASIPGAMPYNPIKINDNPNEIYGIEVKHIVIALGALVLFMLLLGGRKK